MPKLNLLRYSTDRGRLRRRSWWVREWHFSATLILMALGTIGGVTVLALAMTGLECLLR